MTLGKQVPRQRDFTAGELDESAMRRDDTPLQRSGGRQMSNKRILATGGLDQRPGRRALFWETVPSRTEQIRIEPETIYSFTFSANQVKIRDANDTLVFTYTTGLSN